MTRAKDVLGGFARERKGKMTEKSRDVEPLSFAEREANDLKELHLSATFLTPFAVAATQDNQVWLSNNQQDYKDHSKSEQKCCTIRCSRVSENRVVHGGGCLLCCAVVVPAATRPCEMNRIIPGAHIAFADRSIECGHLRTNLLRWHSAPMYTHALYVSVSGGNSDMTPVVVKQKTDMVSSHDTRRMFVFT